MSRHLAVILSLVVLALTGCKPVAETDTPAEAVVSDGSGKITGAEGDALTGAMVTTHLDGRSVTVFTGARGRFSLPRHIVSQARRITIRYPGLQPLEVEARDIAKTHRLHPAKNRLADIPSSRWLNLLPDAPMRREFILNCASCHEIGGPRVLLGGAPRTADHWLAGMTMMRAIDVYSVIPPDFDDQGYARWLAEHLTPAAIDTLVPPPALDGELAQSLVITEYELPLENALPHDLVVGPQGRIWVTAFLNDMMWALDPETGAYESYQVDHDPNVNAQPRALEFASDGDLWIVNGETHKVLKLDTTTGDYRSFDVDMYAHSLDLDPAGNVWVNDYFAAEERIARIDASTGEVDIKKMPASGRPREEGLPLPYGLQVDRQGRLYSTQLAANTLIVYDTVNDRAEILEMPAPNSGPRRPGVGPDGSVWIPEFNTGHVTRFDPTTGEFRRVDLGIATLGAYDVEVDQRRGTVWITGSLDASLIRLDPESGEIVRIPLPTAPAYTRHIAIDPESGDVWTAYSSLPPANPRVARVQFRR